MTIKQKLLFYTFITMAGIAIIGGVSLVGMRFVQGKLAVLTERSTPYQLKTIELQRSLQEHTANLLKVAAATSPADLTVARSEAEKSAAEVKKISSELASFTGSSSSSAADEKLATITDEMLKTTDERLKAEQAALAADQAMKVKLQEITRRLTELDGSMNKLQKSSSRQLTVSSDKSQDITQRLMNLTMARDAIKDINFAFLEIQKAEGKKGVLIARSKLDTGFNDFFKNRLLSGDQGDFKAIAEDMDEARKLAAGPKGLLELKGAVLAKTDEEAKAAYGQVVQSIGSKLNNGLIAVDQMITVASERYKQENKQHEDSLKGSTMAGDSLAMNADLISQGFDIKSRSGELFAARSPQELTRIAGEIGARFTAAEAVQAKLRSSLNAARRNVELRSLQGVAGSLQEIKGLLFAKEGVVAKLQQVQTIQLRAQELNGRLKNLLVEQREEGKRGMTTAQTEQEKAVKSVNRVVRTNVTTVLVIGLTVLVVGIVFSRILTRSITGPIGQLGNMAAGFGNGDFNQRLDASRRDEFGQLAGHFNQATTKLTEITLHLIQAIQQLANGSQKLNRTAEVLNRNAQLQTSQTDQSASAMTEMSQTISEVAQHAVAAAQASKEALEIAAQGKGAVEETVSGMHTIAASTKEAALTIGRLDSHSAQIDTIIATIRDIADQTNLLALNAAIEAARAGEHGAGFAVVADEVRKLAERTTDATREVADMVKAIQADTTKSVSVMRQGEANVVHGLNLADQAAQALAAIVAAADRGAEMVERIATATEEQSAVAAEVSSSMEKIAEITHDEETSTAEITAAAEELNRLASELSSMAQWFKIDGGHRTG